MVPRPFGIKSRGTVVQVTGTTGDVRRPEEDADVPAFWRALGVPGLADIHTHFLPPRMLRRVWEYFDAAGPLVGVRWPIRYKWSDEERVAHMRDMGVRMFSALAYAHRPGMAADLTRGRWRSRRPRRNACRRRRSTRTGGGRVRALGGGGGGADLQGAPAGGRVLPADPLLDEVWGLLAEAEVPVVVHAGHAPVGTEHTGPGPFGSVLARYPGLTAIIAHLGAPDYEAFLRLAADYERVRLDTTMIFTDFFDPWPRSRPPRCPGRRAGAGGQDPPGKRFPHPLPLRRPARRTGPAGLGDDWLRAVCWDNPVALFGVPG